MTVTLIAPVLGQPDDRVLHEALTEAPSFIIRRHPQRSGWLWHRPRSGYHSYYEWRDEITTTWQLWCGGFARADQCMTSDDPPIGDAVCGTCDGRAIGAGQIPGTTPYRTQFAPRYATAPKWCPGSGRRGLWVETEGGTRASSAARCLVCGSAERVRYMGGYYTGGPGLTKHRPADGILDTRCDLHAWRHLVKARTQHGDLVALCRCEVHR